MSEETVRFLLGSINSEDPIKRAIAVGVLSWFVVQYLVKPFTKDKRFYVLAAIGSACVLNLLAAAATDQLYLLAFLYGIAVGLMTSGGHELADALKKLTIGKP